MFIGLSAIIALENDLFDVPPSIVAPVPATTDNVGANVYPLVVDQLSGGILTNLNPRIDIVSVTINRRALEILVLIKSPVEDCLTPSTIYVSKFEYNLVPIADVLGVIDGVILGVGVIDRVIVGVGVIVLVKLIVGVIVRVGVGVIEGVRVIVGVMLGVRVIVGVIEILGVKLTCGAIEILGVIVILGVIEILGVGVTVELKLILGVILGVIEILGVGSITRENPPLFVTFFRVNPPAFPLFSTFNPINSNPRLYNLRLLLE